MDRRSDVFSLGTLLWETLTGHRLFKRNNKLLVLKAISEGPIPPPSSVSTQTPPELDAVCMKALSRSRSERYQSAAEVRRDLMRVTRQLAGDDVLDESLRELMFKLFDDRIDEKRQMLARLQAGSELTSLPAAEVDRAIELPSVEIDLDVITGTNPVPKQPLTVAPEPVVDKPTERKWRRPALLAGAGLVAALLTAVVIGVAGAEPDESVREGNVPVRSDPGLAAGPRSKTITGSAAGRSPELGSNAPAARAGADAATAAGGERTPAAPVSNEVVVRIESTPVRADVTLDGEERGPTPLALTLVRSQTALPLELHADGYASELMTLTPDGDQRILVRLREEPTPRGGARPRPRRGPAKARKYHRFD
ncbi:MAG: PEGA domain-containing protein [Deltaproteobacteria bacterium]|nr:PEGA domain-containing protein [Deltaproteobacteria bacterium]